MKINRDPYKKTILQWIKSGRVVNTGAVGEECWTNQFCQHKGIYYHIDDTHIATEEELKAAKEPFLAEKREKAKKKRAAEKAAREKEEAYRLRFENARKQLKDAITLPVIHCPNPSKIVVFDTETTGHNCNLDEILQFSAIDGEGNILLNTYIRPYLHEAWPAAEYINHISQAMVQDAPQLHELIPKIRGIFDSAELLISYNGEFDMGFLECCGVDFTSKEHFDVMLEFAPIFGEWNEHFQDYTWQKLTTCAAYYGFEFKAHDSLEDCRAVLYCYRAILSEN